MTSFSTILGSELILFKSNCESLMLSMMNRVKWSNEGEGSKMLFRMHSLYYGSDRCNCSYIRHFKGDYLSIWVLIKVFYFSSIMKILRTCYPVKDLLSETHESFTVILSL